MNKITFIFVIIFIISFAGIVNASESYDYAVYVLDNDNSGSGLLVESTSPMYLNNQRSLVFDQTKITSSTQSCRVSVLYDNKEFAYVFQEQTNVDLSNWGGVSASNKLFESNYPFYDYLGNKLSGPVDIPYDANIINDAWLDYILVVPNQDRDYTSWNVKVSVKESTPLGDYWRYLDQYIFLGKEAWKFDKTSPIWQGRDKLYKFDISYINDDEEVGSSVIEPSWNPLEEQISLMPKFTIKNNDWKIQLASTFEADYRIILNKVLAPSTLVNTSVIPVNLVDDLFHLSDTFTTFYNMPEAEVGFYYELYIMNADKTKLYAKFNWTRNDLKDWKKYEFTIDTPLKYDIVSLVSNQYGSEDYVEITPDVVLDGNGNFIVSPDPLGSAIDGLSSIKGSILGANTLMLSVVDMLTGYPLVATGVLMMSGVMVILVAVVIVKIFK